MINIRPDEISNIIRQQIESYDQEVQIDNVGTVFKLVTVLLVFTALSKLWLVSF